MEKGFLYNIYYLFNKTKENPLYKFKRKMEIKKKGNKQRKIGEEIKYKLDLQRPHFSVSDGKILDYDNNGTFTKKAESE